jgi:hypothetical protein
MRTTVTLDPDVEQLLRERMTKRGVSFKQALNDSIREGNVRAPAGPATRTARLGIPRVSLDRALQIAAELEDEELAGRLERDS